MNRRSLLQGLSFSMLAAKLSGASSLYGEAEVSQPQPARTLSANDRIQVGFIGPGSRGQELIRQLLRTPGVEIAAQCDVYKPRFAEVNEMVGKNIPAHTGHRELLDRKDPGCYLYSDAAGVSCRIRHRGHEKRAACSIAKRRLALRRRIAGMHCRCGAKDRPGFFKSATRCDMPPGLWTHL